MTTAPQAFKRRISKENAPEHLFPGTGIRIIQRLRRVPEIFIPAITGHELQVSAGALLRLRPVAKRMSRDHTRTNRTLL